MNFPDSKLKKQSAIDCWDYTKTKLDRLLKKLENKERWDFIKDKLENITKNDCKKNDTLLKVLLSMKRIFNKTPISLKTASTKEDLYYRRLALFILVNYSNISFGEISTEFKIELSILKEYKNQEQYKKLYKKPLEEYFKEKIISYAFEKDCHIGFWSSVNEDKFNELANEIIQIAKENKE